MLLGQHLKEKGTDGVLLRGSVHCLKRIGSRGWNGRKSMSNGRTSSGMRFYGVMKHGHNLEGILVQESLVDLRRSSIRTVCNQDIRGRLGGCFGA